MGYLCYLDIPFAFFLPRCASLRLTPFVSSSLRTLCAILKYCTSPTPTCQGQFPVAPVRCGHFISFAAPSPFALKVGPLPALQSSGWHGRVKDFCGSQGTTEFRLDVDNQGYLADQCGCPWPWLSHRSLMTSSWYAHTCEKTTWNT